MCVAAACLRASVPQGLAWRLRAAIKEQRLPEFVRGFLAGMFPAGDVPQWVVDALDFAGQASRRFSSVSQSIPCSAAASRRVCRGSLGKSRGAWNATISQLSHFL